MCRKVYCNMPLQELSQAGGQESLLRGRSTKLQNINNNRSLGHLKNSKPILPSKKPFTSLHFCIFKGYPFIQLEKGAFQK